MPTINGRACVVNGTPVDKVFSNGRQVYGRNMIPDSGFESGRTPANYVWGDGDTKDRIFQATGQVPSFPTPFGNYMLRVENDSTDSSTNPDQYVQITLSEPVSIKKGETWTYSYYYAVAGSATGQASDYVLTTEPDPLLELSMAHDSRDASGGQTTWHRFVKTWTADRDITVMTLRYGFTKTSASPGWVCIDNIKLAQGPTVSPWSPNPADPEYNSWRYGLTGNVSIPYSGTVPCNQLEQQFAIELTAKGAASSLSFKIDDTELTYSGGVASGDVFLFTGFSYTQNGLSIVSKTNKAYFVLQPDKPNLITCNVPGTVRIIGFQNLYA